MTARLARGFCLRLLLCFSLPLPCIAQVAPPAPDPAQLLDRIRRAEGYKNRSDGDRALALGLLLGALVYLYRRLYRANRTTREQAAQLREMDTLKSRFFANVSHELRTPLSLILGPLENLRERGQYSSEERNLLEIAERGGDQLNRLIDDILNLSKLEAGRAVVNHQATALAQFFDYHLQQFRGLASSQAIALSTEVSLPDGLTVELDREKTRQILYNLLGNALKFTPAGGEVRVRISSLPDRELTLIVADSGPGIAGPDLDRIFERYYQSSQLGLPLSGGTGIGLALSREYTHLLGGSIDVVSQPGRGAVFTVRLPLSPTGDPATLPVGGLLPEQRSIARPVISPPVGTARPRLLLVEDNDLLREHLRLLLTEEFELALAEDGKRAWELLTDQAAAQPIDLVLTDLMMPTMDGYQLLRLLKSTDTTRLLPTVVLTARSAPDDRLRALRIGVDDYLTKPFRAEELRVRIRNLLRNRDERRRASARERAGAGSAAGQPDQGQLPVKVTREDEQFLHELEAYVRSHLGDPDLAVPDVARAFAMSESKLLRLVKRLTGLSTKKYISEIRLTRALLLLGEGHYATVSEVATACGYRDLCSFSRGFRNRFGKSPSECARRSGELPTSQNPATH